MTGSILCVLFLATPFCIIPSLAEFTDLPQSAAALVLAFAALSAWSVEAARRGTAALPGAAISVEFAAFIAWSLLAIAWASDRYLASSESIYMLGCGIVFFLVATGRPDGAADGRIVDSLLVAWGCAIALGLGQAIFKVDWIEQPAPPGSLFANRNMAAQYVVMVLPFALVRLFLPGRFAARAAVYAASLGGVLFVILTESRAALLASAAVLLLMVPTILLLKPRRRRAALALAGLILLPIAAASLLSEKGSAHSVTASLARIGDELASNRQLPSSPQVRLRLWRNALEMARDHPLVGVGGGNFEVHLPKYDRLRAPNRFFGFEVQARYAHNEYLQVLTDYGAVGLFLYLALFFALAGRAWRCARQSASATDRLRALGTGATVLAYLVLSAFSFPLHRSMPPLLLALAGGILVQVKRRGAPGAARFITVGRVRGMLLIGAAAIAMAAVFAGAVCDLRADYHYNRARSAFRAEDWRSAFEEGVRSREACPIRVDGPAVAGAAALHMEDPARAITALSRVVASRPWHVNSLLNLGVAWTAAGRPELGTRHTELVLALLPENALAHANLGYQYGKAGRHDRAVEHLRSAVDGGADTARNRSYLGTSLYHLERYRESAREFEEALRLDPSLAEAHRYLALLYSNHLGEPERGARHAERLEATVPGSSSTGPGAEKK